MNDQCEKCWETNWTLFSQTEVEITKVEMQRIQTKNRIEKFYLTKELQRLVHEKKLCKEYEKKTRVA